MNYKKETRKCKHCEVNLGDKVHKSKKFCSSQCTIDYKQEQKYKDKIEGHDYIICPLCNKKYGEITLSHVKTHGFESINDFLSKTNMKTNKCQVAIDRFSGKNNPGYNHKGKLSPWSKNNKKLSEENLQENYKKAEIARIGKRPNELQYWLDRDFTEDEAKIKQSERQTTFSLDICIEKYGEIEGYKKWIERQDKWLTSYKKQNFSKISQVMFWEIFDLLQKTSNIYFATKTPDGGKSDSNINYEYRLKLDNKCILPDFIDIDKKLVIEFDGVYWHSEKNRKSNPSRELERDNILINNGYGILHINEQDYKDNKEEVINRCISFLNGK